MKKFVIEGKTVSLYPAGEKNSPIIYLHTYAGEGGQVYQALRDIPLRGCSLFTRCIRRISFPELPVCLDRFGFRVFRNMCLPTG